MISRLARWVAALALAATSGAAGASSLLMSLGGQPSSGGSWQACAKEGEVCRFSGTASVTYGAGKSWKTLRFTNGANCSNTAFGGDPAPNQRKTCYTSMPWRPCASEGGMCQFSGAASVTYGAGSQWRTRNFQNGAPCNNSAFGGDPAPNQKKMCYLEGSAGTTVSNRIDSRWARCANEGGNCRVGGQRSVAYGAQGKWVYRTVSGGITCSNEAFRRDPNPGVAKACYVEP